jgi:hypothetical protein
MKTRFESLYPDQEKVQVTDYGSVAQLVEHAPEEGGVPGSNPGGATIKTQ